MCIYICALFDYQNSIDKLKAIILFVNKYHAVWFRSFGKLQQRDPSCNYKNSET